MKLFIKLFITLSIVSFVQAAIAEVVLLTDDKTTTLDLTSKEGVAVDLFECGLYVLEEGGNAYLVHSKGRLPMPKLAMKRMMDDGLVEVDTKGALLGLKLVSMLLPYSREPGKFPNPYKFEDKPNWNNKSNDRVLEDGGMTFFVAERELKIAAILKRKLPKTRFIPSKKLGNENVVILLNPAYLHAVGGDSAIDYFLSEWLRKPPLIQVEYGCGVKQDQRSNPYFNKQNEVFRFGQ